jgi:hypothetical protein
MSMPPGEPLEPPTAPMTPYPAAPPPPSSPPAPSYQAPAAPSYEPPPAPSYQPPPAPAYEPPPAPSYEPQYQTPAAPTYPDYPAADSPYTPPAPAAPPAAPAYAPPAQYAPPPYVSGPQSPSAAPQYPGGIASSDGDPLVLAPGAQISAWFTVVLGTAKRSWKSALIIATLGIGVPRAIANLIAGIAGWGGSWTVGDIPFFFTHMFDGASIVGLFFALVGCVAGCYAASVGWAAGVWALVQEAATGRSANLGQAFGYGFKRATGLFPWTVAAGAIFAVGYALLLLPGLYIAFAVSLFGLVALFERGGNPLVRSVQLTHKSATLGPTLLKVGLSFVGYAILAGIAHAIFAVIGGIFGVASRISGLSDGVGTPYAIVTAIGEIFTGPAFAVLLICLLPTYAELRARENGGATTSQLQQQLG